MVIAELPGEEVAHVGGGADQRRGEVHLPARPGQRRRHELPEHRQLGGGRLKLLPTGAFVLREGQAAGDRLGEAAEDVPQIGSLHAADRRDLAGIGALSLAELDEEVVSQNALRRHVA